MAWPDHATHCRSSTLSSSSTVCAFKAPARRWWWAPASGVWAVAAAWATVGGREGAGRRSGSREVVQAIFARHVGARTSATESAGGAGG